MVTPAVTDAEILSTVFETQMSEFSREAARSILGLKFSDEQNARMHCLLQKNNQDTLTDEERAEMESFGRVGNLLNLLKSKARLSLKQNGDSEMS